MEYGFNVVYETTKYEIFNKYEHNRTIDICNCKKMKNEIEKYGQLAPIIVDKNFAVIDGQHRLEVIKELNKPVMFIRIDKIYNIEEIQSLQIGKPWALNTYIDNWAERGNQNYIDLLSYCKQYNLSTSILLPILASSKFISRDIIISGKYTIDRSNITKNILNIKKLNEIRNVIGVMNDKLPRVFITLFDHINYNHQKMLSQLEKYYKLKFKDDPSINCHMSRLDLARVFEDIYNFNIRNKTEIVDRYKFLGR